MQASETQRDLDRFTADMLYVEDNREDLLRRYPEQWIAVYGREVVAAADELDTLLGQLQQRGIAPGLAYREHLSARDEQLILSCGG
jgi:hypothetical protein